MSTKSPTFGDFTPPRRVQVVKAAGSTGYWKAGQFGYALGYDTRGGVFPIDGPHGPTKTGELVYLVSKSKGLAGGALWFRASALRFTGRKAA